MPDKLCQALYGVSHLNFLDQARQGRLSPYLKLRKLSLKRLSEVAYARGQPCDDPSVVLPSVQVLCNINHRHHIKRELFCFRKIYSRREKEGE